FKKENRNKLVCHRPDGTVEIADIGPNFPAHDIAHFVIESNLKLKNGFYGNILSGYTVEQLSKKEIIITLHVESAISEIATRALQSLASGAVEISQFNEIIRQEFNQWGIDYSTNFSPDRINKLLTEYKKLQEAWGNI